MVCLGNICRSPLAEGILRSKVNPEKIFIDSAGTAAYHIGEPPDPRSISVALKYGIDLRSQKARKLILRDFMKFDRIYAMDEHNYQKIISLAQNDDDKKKVKMILNEVIPAQNLSVLDPYYGGDQGFEEVYQYVREGM